MGISVEFNRKYTFPYFICYFFRAKCSCVRKWNAQIVDLNSKIIDIKSSFEYVSTKKRTRDRGVMCIFGLVLRCNNGTDMAMDKWIPKNERKFV